MKTGDHIYVKRGIYTHHGIYIGKRRVIHFHASWSGIGGAKSPGIVKEVAISTFSKGRKIHVQNYEDRLQRRRTVALAKSSLGDSNYHLTKNNCEHLAVFCVTGCAYSEQIPLLARLMSELMPDSIFEA